MKNIFLENYLSVEICNGIHGLMYSLYICHGFMPSYRWNIMQPLAQPLFPLPQWNGEENKSKTRLLR